MLNVRTHNPALRSRLAAFITQGDAEGLLACLGGLSNMEFRTAGFLLAEDLLPALAAEGEDATQEFWKCFAVIVPSRPKAYLGTFLKAAASLYAKGSLHIDDERFAAFAETQATPIDRRKMLETLLPIVRTVEEIDRLLHLLVEEDAKTRAAWLIKSGTDVAYYRLFHILKTLDEDRPFLCHCCVLLVRRGDRLSCNMASILHEYFGLDELPATFSFQLRPYQLGRLDDSFEHFMKMLH